MLIGLCRNRCGLQTSGKGPLTTSKCLVFETQILVVDSSWVVGVTVRNETMDQVFVDILSGMFGHGTN